MRETVSSFLPRRPGRMRTGGQDIPQEGTRIRAIYDKLATGEAVSFPEYSIVVMKGSIAYLRNIYGFTIVTEHRGDNSQHGRATYRLIE